MALAYVPITLTNNESTATGSGFQQLLLNIDMRSYEPFLNDDLSNVYFSSDSAGSTVINSWLESGNSSTSAATTWWVVTSVAANSTTTIYMQVDLSGTSHRNNTTTGEAPQLSSTYAEYDNGANVFTNYWNFAGTGLPTGWTTYGGSVTQNNGVVFSTSGVILEYTASKLPITNILEWYQTGGNSGSTQSVGGGYSVDSSGNPNTASGAFDQVGSSAGDVYAGSINQQSNGEGSVTAVSGESYSQTGLSSVPSQPYIAGTYVAGSTAYATFNYNTVFTQTSSVPATGDYYTWLQEGTGMSNFGIYWLRTRTYPPSGVMPTVGLGQPTNFPYINTSTNPVEVPDF